MNEQYLLFLNNFKEHLSQLKMCETKVKDIMVKSNKLCEAYTSSLLATSKDITEIVNKFKNNVSDLTIEDIDKASIDATLIREKNNFFMTTYDVLASGECDVKKQLKANISKLNLLYEASSKLKFFISDRVIKIKAKFPEENHEELNYIDIETIKIADWININTSKLNATIAFCFSEEIEYNSKLQTFEAVVSELKKRYSTLD